MTGFVDRRRCSCDNGRDSFSVPTLVSCLGHTRACFLSFGLPTVHHGLVRTVSYSDAGSMTCLVLGFFSRCTGRMHHRVRCRGRTMFACMRRLLRNGLSSRCGVTAFTDGRGRVSAGLGRLGGVVVGCCPRGRGGGLLGTILFSVFGYRRSLTARYRMRSCVFIPTMTRVREGLGGRRWCFFRSYRYEGFNRRPR